MKTMDWSKCSTNLRFGKMLVIKSKKVNFAKASEVTLARTEDSSPKFLEEHSPIDDLIQFVRLENKEEQLEWVAKEIQKNLNDDDLCHNDILVISPKFSND